MFACSGVGSLRRTMSANSTVTWRRSPSPSPKARAAGAEAAGSAATPAPQAPQNLSAADTSASQRGQRAATGAPQDVQKRTPAASVALQAAQSMRRLKHGSRVAGRYCEPVPSVMRSAIAATMSASGARTRSQIWIGSSCAPAMPT